MKNKEKYVMKIVDISCDGKSVAVDKRTGKVVSCDCIMCGNCLFDGKHGCNSRRREWAESEYVECPVISKSDRMFLDYIKEEYKCIARDKNGELFLYRLTPYKEEVILKYQRNLLKSLTGVKVIKT
ncbi:hypothetical protein [Holdemanella sp.]|uniref:hypothetical protein n=1 Tax=Holdemanella sp. TaxID=1971762 RepID=UPI003AEF5C69